MLEYAKKYNMSESEVMEFASNEMGLTNKEISSIKDAYNKSNQVEFKNFINYLNGSEDICDRVSHAEVIRNAYKLTEKGDCNTALLSKITDMKLRFLRLLP